jgi:hypothetical protein
MSIASGFYLPLDGLKDRQKRDGKGKAGGGSRLTRKYANLL